MKPEDLLANAFEQWWREIKASESMFPDQSATKLLSKSAFYKGTSLMGEILVAKLEKKDEPV